jgi:hypothetical protein
MRTIMAPMRHVLADASAGINALFGLSYFVESCREYL